MNIFISFFLINIPILVNVAFFTLLERKVLSFVQSRKGPNKVGVAGLLQPFADAVKLFVKGNIIPLKSVKFLFFACPVLDLGIALCVWCFMPFGPANLANSASVLFFLVILSIGVYPVFVSGWASNSSYAMKGAVRSIAQAISYEISLAVVFLTLLLLSLGGSWGSLVNGVYELGGGVFFFPLLVFWFLICLVETNRTPFDFAEAESELVSGFNVEYGSFLFALIFMAEYAKILFFSGVSGMLIMGVSYMGYLWGPLSLLTLGCVWIWLRGTFPRYRYDKLMLFCWKVVLPYSLLLGFSMILI